jgi:uncharacterized protein (DUF2461 family)
MTQFPLIFAFLHDLRQNNNHEWFEAHRTEYEEAKALFEDFIQASSSASMLPCPWAIWPPKMPSFASGATCASPKTWPPYKSHFSAVLAPGGRHSAAALLHPHHARRIASGERRAHAHICRSARPFAWQSRRNFPPS